MPTIGTADQLDRAARERTDPEWLARMFKDRGTKVAILADLKTVVESNADKTETHIRWFPSSEIRSFELTRTAPIFLGLAEDGTARFALPLTDHRLRAVGAPPQTFRPLVDLRTLAASGAMPREELAILSLARALAAWHRTQRCCGYCGSNNRTADGGWKLVCWACGQAHFPRTDPCVIMLVTDGDRCLLGHEQRFEDNMYSTLAGFVEPGEDIEHAVRREVEEEVGIKVGKVHYLESQPWPFPHSLMIGCEAIAETTEITLDPAEVEDALWFTRQDVQSMLDGAHSAGLFVPGQFSVARKLIKRFAEGH